MYCVYMGKVRKKDKFVGYLFGNSSSDIGNDLWSIMGWGFKVVVRWMGWFVEIVFVVMWVMIGNN
jgi:hypothetical protein